MASTKMKEGNTRPPGLLYQTLGVKHSYGSLYPVLEGDEWELSFVAVTSQELRF